MTLNVVRALQKLFINYKSQVTLSVRREKDLFKVIGFSRVAGGLLFSTERYTHAHIPAS